MIITYRHTGIRTYTYLCTDTLEYVCISDTPRLLRTWRIYLSVRKQYTEGKYVSSQNDWNYIGVMKADGKFCNERFLQELETTVKPFIIGKLIMTEYLTTL